MKCCGKMPRRRLSAAAACAVILFLSARPADPGIAFVFEDLNFAFVLPEMMRGHTDITRDEQNFGSEKVTTILIAYTAGTLSANVTVSRFSDTNDGGFRFVSFFTQRAPLILFVFGRPGRLRRPSAPFEPGLPACRRADGLAALCGRLTPSAALRLV